MSTELLLQTCAPVVTGEAETLCSENEHHTSRATAETAPLEAPEPRAEVASVQGEESSMLLQRLAQNMAEQNEKWEALRALCEKDLFDNNSKDEAIARMQKRLEEYERGMLRALKEPLLRDLMLFYDSLVKLLHKCENGPPARLDYARELELLRAELLEIFSTQSMERIALPGESRYQSDLQKAVQIENAEQAEENQLVVRVVREGFTWEGRVLRKQEVAVKKWSDRATERSAAVP